MKAEEELKHTRIRNINTKRFERLNTHRDFMPMQRNSVVFELKTGADRTLQLSGMDGVMSLVATPD